MNPKAGKFDRSAELPVWEGDDAPPREHHLKELLWNAGRLLGTFRKRGPRGPDDGQPVLVIPGFLCSDQTTFSLRRELARAGYRVHGWKQGWNLGARENTIDQLRSRIENLGHDRKLVIVGWSLGGLFAREYGRYHPEQVLAVITLGSPFSGDPRQNNVWRLYERVAGHSVAAASAAASDREAAGASPCTMVAARRVDRPSRGTRSRSRAGRRGGAGLPSHGVRNITACGQGCGAGNRQVSEKPRINSRGYCFGNARTSSLRE